MQHVEGCGDGWWQQGKLLQLSPQMGSNGYAFREGFKENQVELWVQLAQSASGLTSPKDARGAGERQKRQCHSQRCLQGNKASLCYGGAVSVV